MSNRLVSAFVAVAVFIAPVSALAESLDSARQQLGTTNQQIQDLKAHADEHAHAAETLEAQIAAMDAEIGRIRAAIADTQAKVAATKAEISRVEAEMAAKKQVLNEYIKAQYYNPNPTTFEALVASDSLGEFMDDQEYVKRGKEKMEQLVAEIQAIRVQLDARLVELQSLQAQLAGQQAGLDAQRAAKNDLLAKTRGEEAKYKQLLEQAEAARARLSATISRLMGSGPMISHGYVERGSVIGREGSTGFSTGSHVHFGVYVGQAATNPWPYINSGRIGMPLANYQMTQNYGPAGWKNSMYSFHDGLDITQYYGAPVLAACSGNIIMNGWQPSGFGHYIVIDCGGGLWALTAHMQQ